MGCSSSKSLNAGGDINDSSSSTFRVIILNTRGHDCSVGRIEVTSRELLLHQYGKPSICWPLAGLRHYGFNDDLFSFESGRRCPTGEGIYAFRSNRAESLFNVLQERIVQAAEQSNRRLAAHQATLLARFHSETTYSQDSRILQPNNHNMYVNTTHDYENRSPMQHSVPSYADRVRSEDDEDPPLCYADLDLPAKQSDECDGQSSCANCDHTDNKSAVECSNSKKRSTYMNVLYENLCSDNHHIEPLLAEGGRVKRRSLSTSSKRSYVNGGLIGKLLGKGKEDLQSNGSGSKAVQALRRASRRSSGASSCGRERTALGYASIDFERTQALTSSHAAGVVDENDGMRKTRHSVSTAEDVSP